ncbi:hypothetical protein AAFF_G00187580 [Aldrovandia affinis]|uniref:Uncharacterized protein n=1 Tax=Aldrovandia affinis TaxID=143900 RepID=A0AAD7WV94_9TELE|nr:hypothetical protein AAFF_G00187580 [Aldrovandia affinis]
MGRGQASVANPQGHLRQTLYWKATSLTDIDSNSANRGLRGSWLHPLSSGLAFLPRYCTLGKRLGPAAWVLCEDCFLAPVSVLRM